MRQPCRPPSFAGDALLLIVAPTLMRMNVMFNLFRRGINRRGVAGRKHQYLAARRGDKVSVS